MSRKARPIEGHICWFCKQPADSDSWMGMGFLKSTQEPIYEGNYILYHEPCAVYSNGAGDLPPDGMDDESVLRFWLHGERCSGIGLRCQLCGLKGATTGCLHGPCQQFYHYPCARVRAFQGHLQFSLQCRSLACSEHLHLLPMPVEEQHLGMWMEGGGSWNGTQLQASTAWLQSYSENKKAFKRQWHQLLIMTPYEELKAKEAKQARKGKRRSDDDPDFRTKKSSRSSNPGSRPRASQQQVLASPGTAGRMSDPGVGGRSTPGRLLLQQQQDQQQRLQLPSAVGVSAEISQAAQNGTAVSRGLAEVASFGAIADALRPSLNGSGVQQQQQAQPLDCDLLLQAAGFMTPRTSNQLYAEGSVQSGQLPSQQLGSAGAAAAAAAAGGSVGASGGVRRAAGGSRTESVNFKAEASSADSAPEGQGSGAAPATPSGGARAAGLLPSKQQQQQHGRNGTYRLQHQHDNGQQEPADQLLQTGERLAAAAAAAGGGYGVAEVPSRLTAPFVHRMNSQVVAALSTAAESSECGGGSLCGGGLQGPPGAAAVDVHTQQSHRRKFLDVNEYLATGRKLLSYDHGNMAVPAAAAGATAGAAAVRGGGAAAGQQLGGPLWPQQWLHGSVAQPAERWATSSSRSLCDTKQSPSSAAAAAAATVAATAAAVLKTVSASGVGVGGGMVTNVGYSDPAAVRASSASLPAGWPVQRGVDMVTWLKQRAQQQQQLEGRPQLEQQQQQQQPGPVFDACATNAAGSSQALQAALKMAQAAVAAHASSAVAQPKSPTAATAAITQRAGSSGHNAAAQKAALEAAALLGKIAADPDMDEMQTEQLLDMVKAMCSYLQPRSSPEVQGLQRTAAASGTGSGKSWVSFGSAQQQLQSPRVQQQQQQHNIGAAAAASTSHRSQAAAAPESALIAALTGLASAAQSGGFSGLKISSPTQQQQQQQIDIVPMGQQQQHQVLGSVQSSSMQKSDSAALLAKLAGMLQRTSASQVTAAPVQAAVAAAPLAQQQQQQLLVRPAVRPAVQGPLISEFFGCVTSLPALQPGEMRAAGITAHPNVIAAYVKQDARQALQLQPWSIVLPPATLKQLAAWGVPANKLASDLYSLLHASNVLNNHLTQDSMPIGFGNPAAAGGQQQQGALQLSGGYAGMPQDLPVRYVRGVMVGPEDPRVDLRGEFGLTATQDLSAGTILGPWRSYVLTSSEYAALISNVPADWQEPPGVDRQQAWWALLHKFTVAFKVPCLEGSDSFGSATNCGQMLHFCALGYGNLTCLANDSVLDPRVAAQAAAAGAAECGQMGQPNVDVVAVLVNGMPLPLMVTTQGVCNGGQLCYSYGREYWQTWCALKVAMR